MLSNDHEEFSWLYNVPLSYFYVAAGDVDCKLNDSEPLETKNVRPHVILNMFRFDTSKDLVLAQSNTAQ